MSFRFALAFFAFLVSLVSSPLASGVAAQDATVDPPPPSEESPYDTDGDSDPGSLDGDPDVGTSSTSSASSSTSGAAAPPPPPPPPPPTSSTTASSTATDSTVRAAEPAPVIHVSVVAPNPRPPPPAAQEEDDGRDADFLWIEAGFGFSWANLAAFSENNFVPGVEQYKGAGYAGHVAAGFKLFLLTFGARGTVASYPTATAKFDLWSVMFDIMLRIPILFAEPYFRAGIGYAWMGDVDFRAPDNSTVSVFGLTIEAGAGIDFYVNNIISLGAGFDVAFLNLTRQRIDMCMDVGGAMCNAGGVDLQEEGDAVGLQMRATGHIAFHF